MALLARQPRMASGQREVAPAMIEIRILPIGRVMAGGAVRSILTVVFVVLSVAGIAIRGRAFEDVVSMAGLASRIRVFPFEPERRKIVIELRRTPTLRRMTDRAIPSKLSLVRIVAEVTGTAILRRHCKIAKSARSRVALRAIQVRVPAGDLELKLVVVEIRNEAVHAVVAIQAGGGIRLDVPRHKTGIQLTMTRVAGLRIEFGDVVRVAIGTYERLARDLELVPFQRESHRLVWELGVTQVGEACVRAAVFGVTMPATQIRLIGQDRTVHGRHVLHLTRDVPVTVHTAILHPCRLPGRGVTGFAVPAGLRMRRDAAQHLPALRVQRARVIHQPSARIRVPRNDERGDERRDHPRPGQTTQTIFITHFPSEPTSKRSRNTTPRRRERTRK